MTENSKDKSKINQKSKEDRMKALKEKANKSSRTSPEDFVKQLATRQKLERDYEEDKLYVSFHSSPETKRTILARKPNQEEFLKILTLTIEASKFEGRMDEKSLEGMKRVFIDLNEMAADLSIDKSLNKEFWSKKVSFTTLQNFIGELINESQKGTGVTEEEMTTFR